MNLPNQAQQPVDKYLGWKTLGAFVLAYAGAWIGGAGWGLGATQIGRLLQLSAPLITTLSLSGIAVIQPIVWGLATRLVLKRRLRTLAFRLHRGWWADLLVGVGMTTLAILVTFIVGVEAGWLVVEGWVWQTLWFYCSRLRQAHCSAGPIYAPAHCGCRLACTLRGISWKMTSSTWAAM